MTISNYDDIIDSRDVIERIEELETEHDDLQEAIALAEDDSELESAQDEWREWVDSNQDEFDSLKALAEEAESYAPDWQHGEALIRETYFTEYAMELLSDIGDLPQEIPWYIVIDEEATAENIKQDYTAVDFDGITYYIR